MNSQSLAVIDSGMVTGVGLTAATTCAAIRCAIDNFQETRFMDKDGEWIMGCEVPLEEPWKGKAKLIKMLSCALQEILERNPKLVPEETPLLLCLSEHERPGRVIDNDNDFFLSLLEEMQIDFHAKSRVIAQGRVSVTVALARARDLIFKHKVPQLIIAGVDGLLVGPGLAIYEENERLLTSQNSNGFVPGEAAAAILVTAPTASQNPQLLCTGLGFGEEKSTIESELPLRADGLVRAIKQATADAGCSLGELDFQVASVSGEQYWFKEASLSVLRTLRVRKEEFDLWHPADCIGEVGAAIGPVILAIALSATKKSYAPGNRMLCHFGNDGGRRATAILTYQSIKAA